MHTQVLIIGGGVTGTGLARDLALRGVQCTLVEKGDINAGASGANHGLLHSGARYVSSDPTAAKECRIEGEILKRLAPHCIENTRGLFVAVEGDDENYVADFPRLCSESDIPVQALDAREARDIEPALSDKTIAAYAVEDASVDPFRLSMENISQALALGSTLLTYHKVVGFKMSRNRIQTTHLINTKTGVKVKIEADQVVNAAGAWASEIAALAGATIDLLYSKGSLLITDHRMTDRVINRLRPSSNADILVPGGTVSILGTTSIRIDSLEDIRPTIEEVDLIIDTAVGMIPALESTRYIRAYAGVRPLVGSTAQSEDRKVSRGFALFDHTENGIENFATIAGGKLTTYRSMAEKTADLVCQKIGNTTPCLTRTQPLPASQACRWTEPGIAPKLWFKQHEPDDVLLCECEMVPKSAVDGILQSLHDQNGVPDLRAIGLRSRIGKGLCQGAFCGVRIAAYMYERGELDSKQGITDLRTFLSGRWKGLRPILWDTSLIQEELQEALHCGLFGLEL
jgi:glycerol-3-phosphate dehydrogenase